jgi:hypothetical protein
MWTFHYTPHKGNRCHKAGDSITTYGPNEWYHPEINRWCNSPQATKYGCGTHKGCRSLKAFKRHLRKHPELQGQEVFLVSRWVGYDIEAKWRE